MRRSSLFSLLGLSTLILASTLSEPSYAQERKKEVTVVSKGKRITVQVAPPDDAPKALSDDEGKAKKAKDKDKDKADKADKDKEKSDKEKDKAEAKSDKEKDKADKADKADKPKEDPVERARKGVVTIERAGEVVGLGSVLGEDGRILTALSPLADGNNVNVRYADGSTVKAKVGHSSRLWDMAMLVPQVGKWGDGLTPSSADPMQQKGLKSFSPGKGKAQAAALAVKGRRTLLGADEQSLPGVLELGTKLGAKEMGAPIIDDQGGVVGMVGRACVPVEKGPCLPSPVGIPTPAIRHFLSTAPPNAVRPAPWLGIRGAAEKGTVSGVRVLGVLPDSPADEAGLKGGSDKALSDLIVAVDDHPVADLGDLGKAVAAKSVGDRMKLLVFRQGKFQEQTVVLQPAPAKK